MSLADSLQRLRAHVETRQAGVCPDVCCVQRRDLLELLRHFDRLDAAARVAYYEQQAGAEEAAE